MVKAAILFVQIGIGEYDASVMPSLEGVRTDYSNIINVFNKTFGYSILYRNSNNDEFKYANNIQFVMEPINNKPNRRNDFY